MIESLKSMFQTQAMMTHKCRGSIIVLSISKSVEPNEEQKENDMRFSVRYSLQALKL